MGVKEKVLEKVFISGEIRGNHLEAKKKEATDGVLKKFNVDGTARGYEEIMMGKFS